MTEPQYTPDSLGEQLDSLLASPRPPQAAPDDDPVIQTAIRLANAPRPVLSPQAMARIRNQVLEASKRQIRPERSRSLSVPRWTRWAAATSAIVALLVIGLLPAAAASLPGDTLYPVKQLVEQAELFFAGSPAAQAEVHLTHAERRVQEANLLLERGQFNPDLVTAALNEMVASASEAQGSVSPGAAFDLQTRAIAVTAHLNALVEQAARTHLTSETTAAALTAALSATINSAQNSSALLLPPVPAPTLTPTIPVMLAPEATSTLEPSPEVGPTLPTTITIEGPVEAIHGSVITIYGINVQLDPNDPLLTGLQVGDMVRVEGNVSPNTATLVINAVTVTSESGQAYSNGQGQVWRDNGQCNNPPPSWAQANGWRQRCGGGGQGNSNPGGSYPGNGNSNGNGNGGGQGMGN